MLFVLLWTSTTAAATKLTAVGAMKTMGDGLEITMGTLVTKSAKPLMIQDEVWEPRLDNGYPNVIYDDDKWQLYYGDCIADGGSCKSQIVLYAESEDGMSWSKPDLGLFDLNFLRPDLGVGKHNNIVLQGGGVGVYKHDDQYIAFGDLCAEYDDLTQQPVFRERDPTEVALPACPGGLGKANMALSRDGVNFGSAFQVDWPKPQAYDTHNNVFFRDDEKFVATTRLKVDGIRSVGIATSTSNDLESFDTSIAPVMTLEAPSEDEQNYAQITFHWHDMYLGLVMVYDADDSSKFGHGKVHCRLAYSIDLLSPWTYVDFSTDFIPLGTQGSSTTDPANAYDSHICFAAKPVTYDTEERIYFMGGNGPHNGDRNSSLGLATLRKDGFLAVAGSGTYETNDLVLSSSLRITADVIGPDGFVTLVAIHGDDVQVTPITTNVTDALLDVDLSPWHGVAVSLRFELSNAALYTISFDDEASDQQPLPRKHHHLPRWFVGGFF